MCDYSLMSFPNRLAVVGEELVVHRFFSGSVGLTSRHDLNRTKKPSPVRRSWWAALNEWFTLSPMCSAPAVCIPPSARLVLRDIAEDFQSKYGVQPEEHVTFQQLSAEPNTYRDALQFRNGRTVSLQELREGQRLKVIDLGNTDPGENEVVNSHGVVGWWGDEAAVWLR